MITINKVLYTELNALAIVILAIIYFNMRHHTTRYHLEQKLFLVLVYFNALILLFDTSMWLIDGVKGAGIASFYRIVTAIYYALNPLVCLHWAYYADFLVYHSESHLKRIMIPLSIPAIVNCFLAIASIFTGWMFSIDANNMYHRGSWFLVMVGISYAYMLYSFVKILLKRNRIQQQYWLSILLFSVPPFIGSILQSLIYGVSLIWICMTISVLIVFTNIQTDQLYTDFLTGLYNRRHLENYLQRLRKKKTELLIGGLMIDLIDFKQVNDVYGHDEGDRALQAFAKILRETFRNRDFVVRMGGDEFLVLAQVDQRQDLERLVQRLYQNVDEYNDQHLVPYEILLSVGYDCYDNQSSQEIDEFICHIDALMYKNKNGIDAQRRQSEDR